MSLKSFHVVFVTASIMMCLVFGAWSVGNFRATGEAAQLFWAAGAVLAAVGLGVYGVIFLRKLKHISYL